MGNACGSKAGVSDTAKKTSAFKTSDELLDFDTFFPKGTKSALARCMTKEMWEEYKDMKDDSDVTFKTCIFSGVKNLDSGIGLYAGSHSSYTKFEKLFDAVIQDYHGHGKEDKHVSDMTSEGIENAEFSEEDAAMIKSSRIRVGRNLDGYPLGPGITKEQRDEVMEKVKTAAETFEDDLKGTFYPLDGMTDETEKQLIADHVLFK
jgi:arginine kinase